MNAQALLVAHSLTHTSISHSCLAGLARRRIAVHTALPASLGKCRARKQ
jgi:hypothetical protein